jgi:AcrR family transcriptional regulator
MPELPTNKREQVREERRQQILEAALKVFSQKGFHSANVSDVAAQAGVSQGTIYWYFDSKDDLFEAALLSVFEQFGADTMLPLAQYTTAREKLLSLADSMVSFAEIAEGLFMLFLGYWASSDRQEESAQIWMDLLAQYKDAVAAIVEEGVRGGEFKPVDADALVWALLAAYDGLAAYATFMPDIDLNRVNRALIGTVLDGLLVNGKQGAGIVGECR